MICVLELGAGIKAVYRASIHFGGAQYLCAIARTDLMSGHHRRTSIHWALTPNQGSKTFPSAAATISIIMLATILFQSIRL